MSRPTQPTTKGEAAVRRRILGVQPKTRWDRYLADSVILAMGLRTITAEHDARLVDAIAEGVRELRRGRRR